MKRTYKAVSVESMESGHTVLLDGKPATTPKKHPLAFPTRDLANAVAKEWSGQAETFAPQTMPLTRLANTALDRAAERDVVGEVMAYAESDLLFYRAEEGPLAERQRAAWDPVLAWAQERFATRFTVTTGIAHASQSAESLATLRRALAKENPFALAALHAATTIAASLILALAMAEGRLAASEVFALSQLDERYQAERWGRDPEARKRARSMEEELAATGLFLSLARA